MRQVHSTTINVMKESDGAIAQHVHRMNRAQDDAVGEQHANDLIRSSFFTAARKTFQDYLFSLTKDEFKKLITLGNGNDNSHFNQLSQEDSKTLEEWVSSESTVNMDGWDDANDQEENDDLRINKEKLLQSLINASKNKQAMLLYLSEQWLRNAGIEDANLIAAIKKYIHQSTHGMAPTIIQDFFKDFSADLNDVYIQFGPSRFFEVSIFKENDDWIYRATSEVQLDFPQVHACCPGLTLGKCEYDAVLTADGPNLQSFQSDNPLVVELLDEIAAKKRAGHALDIAEINKKLFLIFKKVVQAYHQQFNNFDDFKKEFIKNQKNNSKEKNKKYTDEQIEAFWNQARVTASNLLVQFVINHPESGPFDLSDCDLSFCNLESCEKFVAEFEDQYTDLRAKEKTKSNQPRSNFINDASYKNSNVGDKFKKIVTHAQDNKNSRTAQAVNQTNYKLIKIKILREKQVILNLANNNSLTPSQSEELKQLEIRLKQLPGQCDVLDLNAITKTDLPKANITLKDANIMFASLNDSREFQSNQLYILTIDESELIITPEIFLAAYKEERFKHLETGNYEKALKTTFYNLRKTQIQAEISYQPGSEKRQYVDELLKMASHFKLKKDLSGLNLSGGDYTNLDLSNVNAEKTNWSRAKLNGCKINSKTNFKNVKATELALNNFTYNSVASSVDSTVFVNMFIALHAKDKADSYSLKSWSSSFMKKINNDTLSSGEKLLMIFDHAQQNPDSRTAKVTGKINRIMRATELVRPKDFKMPEKSEGRSKNNIQLFINTICNSYDDEKRLSPFKSPMIKTLKALQNDRGFLDQIKGENQQQAFLCLMQRMFPAETLWLNHLLDNEKITNPSDRDAYLYVSLLQVYQTQLQQPEHETTFKVFRKATILFDLEINQMHQLYDSLVSLGEEHNQNLIFLKRIIKENLFLLKTMSDEDAVFFILKKMFPEEVNKDFSNEDNFFLLQSKFNELLSDDTDLDDAFNTLMGSMSSLYFAFTGKKNQMGSASVRNVLYGSDYGSDFFELVSEVKDEFPVNQMTNNDFAFEVLKKLYPDWTEKNKEKEAFRLFFELQKLFIEELIMEPDFYKDFRRLPSVIFRAFTNETPATLEFYIDRKMLSQRRIESENENNQNPKSKFTSRDINTGELKNVPQKSELPVRPDNIPRLNFSKLPGSPQFFGAPTHRVLKNNDLLKIDDEADNSPKTRR